MPIRLEIVEHPHPALRTKAKPIVRVDAELGEIVQQMFDLMYEAQGVGLAANQVGLPIRLFVANPTGERGEGEEYVMINPEIQLPGGSETQQEGCLSLPDVRGQVTRPKTIRVSAYDLSGAMFDKKVDGFLARVFQHENDHLDGILFTDRMAASDEKVEADDQIAKMEEGFRAKQESGDMPSDTTLVADLKPYVDRYT